MKFKDLYLLVKRKMHRHVPIKKYSIYFIILIGVVTFYNLYNGPSHESLILKLRRENLKSVQLLTGRFDWKNWGLGELGLSPFKQCPENRCYAFKTSILQTPNENSDGIMVHFPNLWYMPSRKKYKRRKEQLWLLYTLESPGQSYCSQHYKLDELDDWFNLTATYRADSNILTNYMPFTSWSDLKYDPLYLDEFQNLIKSSANIQSTITDLSRKRNSYNKFNTKNGVDKPLSYDEKPTAVWFVSHCETDSKREDYVNDLKKYLKIDIFGKCGQPFPCKSNYPECFNDLLNSYKFYLSFENSLCDEYITEKFWKLYRQGTIFTVNTLPVVRGAKEEHYKNIAKPHSYINSMNFKSAEELGKYLAYLNKNDTAYLEYFKWKIDLYKEMSESLGAKNSSKRIKRDYRLTDYLPFCEMCSHLHNKTFLKSDNNKIWKITDWFSKEKTCWDSTPNNFRYWAAQFIGFCF